MRQCSATNTSVLFPQTDSSALLVRTDHSDGSLRGSGSSTSSCDTAETVACAADRGNHAMDLAESTPQVMFHCATAWQYQRHRCRLFYCARACVSSPPAG